MLIECLIEREGGTPVQVGQVRLYFCPRPELTRGDTQSNVCEVNMKEMQDYLLSTPQGNFVKYVKGSDYGGRKKFKEVVYIDPPVEEKTLSPGHPFPEQEESGDDKELLRKVMALDDELLEIKGDLQVAGNMAGGIIDAAMEELTPPEGFEKEPTLLGMLAQIKGIFDAVICENEELKAQRVASVASVAAAKPVKPKATKAKK